MPDSMIEQISRVLCKRECDDPDRIVAGEGKAAGTSWLGWHAYASEAREIISAMREPTKRMVSDGAFQAFRGKAITDDDLATARRVWRAMTRAALAESVEAPD